MSNSSRPISVIKVGGALLEQSEHLLPFWESVRILRKETDCIVVHGGGPQATGMARRLGHEPRIVHGRRVTTDLDLDIMKWTLRGALNVQLAAQASHAGVPSVGLCGVDGPTLIVTKRPPWNVEGEEIDFGWVGDVVEIRSDLLLTLVRSGFTPIVAPLGVDLQGFIFNVNADTVACAIAGASGASTFLMATESGGVYRDVSKPDSLLKICDQELFQSGINDGWIAGGMRVKLQVAFEALKAGVENVYILAADDLTNRSLGTRVVHAVGSKDNHDG